MAGGGTGLSLQPAQPTGMTGSTYNQNLQSGMTDAQMRAANPQYSNNQWNDIVTQAGMQSPTSRPLAGSAQFYQPVYQQQTQNYSMTNPMGVSQYGQSFGGMPQMQTPFSMFGGQMQGGGYGQYGTNNPYSPYSNTFLNMPTNLQGATADQKADMYRDAMSRGFNDQQLRNQATGLYGPQSDQAWGWLQGLSMGMSPGLGQGTQQDKANFYNQARNQGYSDSTIRNAANQMIGQQSQGDWNYLQNYAGDVARGAQIGFTPALQQGTEQDKINAYNQARSQGYSDQAVRQVADSMYGVQSQPDWSYLQGKANYGGVPQMQTPFRSSGPSQPIVSRSAGMRGTPNVIRRAEGGIASLVDDE